MFEFIFKIKTIRLTACAIFLLKVPELQGRQWTNKEGQKLVADLTEVIDSKP